MSTTIRPSPEVAPLVALIGQQATLALLDAYAGVRIEVPQRVRETSALARAIGPAAARRLARELGGTRLNVPVARRWRAMHMREAGLSYSEIARKLGMSESGVYRALADHGMTRQMDLPLLAQG